MNFLFVDQLLKFELGIGAVGIKHVTAQDAYLIATPSGKPALRSCIVGEALGQLCSWYIIKATDAKLRSVAGIVSKVVMTGQAYLGDTIELNIGVDRLDDEAVIWHGEAKVAGQTIVVVESSVGPCLPMADFNDPEEVRIQLKMIDRPGTVPAAQEAQTLLNNEIKYYPELVSFDTILAWESGKQIIAQKKISVIAPFFTDHFPRKPVLPLTILLEAKLNLAQKFIADMLGEIESAKFYPSSVRNIKMKDFVQPGSVLTSKIFLKEQNDSQIIIGFRSDLNDKLVCVAEAEFSRIS